MTELVTLPRWLFLLMALLAAWAVLVLMLAPGMRWFLRRRINRMIEQLNSRLSIELPSFSTAIRTLPEFDAIRTLIVEPVFA